jgi:hypothetical protein
MTERGQTFSPQRRTSNDKKDVDQANENATPRDEGEPFATSQETFKETRFRKIASRARGGSERLSCRSSLSENHRVAVRIPSTSFGILIGTKDEFKQSASGRRALYFFNDDGLA